MQVCATSPGNNWSSGCCFQQLQSCILSSHSGLHAGMLILRQVSCMSVWRCINKCDCQHRFAVSVNLCRWDIELAIPSTHSMHGSRLMV